jgi:hypothetical protein
LACIDSASRQRALLLGATSLKFIRSCR